MTLQKTIREKLAFSGTGLHSGRVIGVEVIPALANSGISFVRKDVPGSAPIRALSDNVVATENSTTIGSGGVTVSTVEHLLAAFFVMGVDNAVVILDGPEVPIMDGSSTQFVSMIRRAGVRALPAERRRIVVKRAVKVAHEGKQVELLPSDDDGLTIEYAMDFKERYLLRQAFSARYCADAFADGVLDARTFVSRGDIDALKAKGLAKGGSLDNALVLGEEGVLNDGGFRYDDECVRHKVLDLIGDLALAGAPISGRVVVSNGGHAMNCGLVRQLLANPSCWELSSAVPEAAAQGLFADGLAMA